MDGIKHFKALYIIEIILIVVGLIIFPTGSGKFAFAISAVLGVVNFCLLVLFFTPIVLGRKINIAFSILLVFAKLLILFGIIYILISKMIIDFVPFIAGFFSIYIALLIFSVVYHLTKK